jgi:CHAD domain-containing protein
MAFRMLEGEGVPDGIRRMAGEQIDKAIAEICEPSLADHEKIHQVRKRCKQLRALLRLVRPHLGDTYAHENAFFRDAARSLSPLRDAQSVLDAYDALMARFEGEVERARFAAVRRRLTLRKRQRAQEVTDLTQRLDQVRGLLEAARERVAAWPVDASGAEAWRGGFEQSYRRARRAMSAAYEVPAPEHFHEWRKGVKYHWYHTRILRPLWDKALAARADAGNVLGEMLGSHHDLVVLRATLLDEAGGFGRGRPISALVELIDRRRSELESDARPLGMRLFAEKAARIGLRHARYWDAWQEEQRYRRATGQEPAAATA